MTTKPDGRRNRPRRFTDQNERIVTTIRLPRRLIAWLDTRPVSRSQTIEAALGSAHPEARMALNLCEIDRLKTEETAELEKLATDPSSNARYLLAHQRRKALEATVNADWKRTNSSPSK